MDALRTSSVKVHQEMCKNLNFNPEMSGTTLTSVIVSGLEMFTCNVGDSRIISVAMMSDA